MTRKVAFDALWRCAIGNIEGISEHGIFLGIIDLQENKLLIIKGKNGLLIIEWE
ncbi:MAG: hypothetical protein GYB33_02310 [Gammaproteobacteria bacterium]|nr:hypothetical protein [Gammaproteobacteria bacterium]